LIVGRPDILAGMPDESDHVPDRRPVFQGIPRRCHRARELNLPDPMATSSLRQLALNSEPPSRRELSIAFLTLCAIMLSFLASRAADYLNGTSMETSTPSSQTDSRTHLV
jgi:hypothetical protein